MSSTEASRLEYGTCRSLGHARDAADEARRDGLRGLFPSACVVLDMHVSNMAHAVRALIASWDDEDQALTVHECIAKLREIATMDRTGLKRPTP